ncbi:MAG: hypothetical protein KA229_09625 [Chitinophagaceae bacterium]|nr:hypothetical protein [Chitinophagaceae bacterium]
MKRIFLLLFLLIILLSINVNAQQWLLTGNTPTAAQFLGTTNNTNLRIRTNGTEKMVVLSGGNVGIGVTAPTGVLHLKAGTATAGTGPLKFTSGVNLTTAEAGVMEYNGSSLSITVGSPSVARKTIAFADLSNVTGTLPVNRGGTGLAALGTANQQLRVNAGGTALEYFTPAGGGGSGTVTSVGLSMPSGFSVANSPVTTSGTLAVTTTLNGIIRGNGTGFTTGAINLATADVTGTLAVANGGTGIVTATGNTVFAAPNNGGSADGPPSFRNLVAADLPALDMSKITTGNLAVSRIGSMNTARLIGRSTAGSGVAEEISLGTGLSLSGGVLSATGGGSGITTLNTLNTASQSFASGTTGTDFGISSAGSVHTFNIPNASATARGLLTAADWSAFNNKAPASGGTGYIQNGTGVQGSSNFNISGNGTIGNNLTMKGNLFQIGSLTQTGQVEINFLQSFNASGNGWTLGYNSPTTSDFRLFGGESAAFRLFTSSAERMTVASNGNVGIGAPSPAYKLDIINGAGDNGIRVQSGNSTNTILARDGLGLEIAAIQSNQAIDFKTGNTSRLYISGTGNVGVGTTPTAKLDVAGTFKLVDGTQGAGKVLTSDASGNASWQTVSGGGGSSQWTTNGSHIYYNTGNVGIGTSTPGYKLEVAGTARINNSLVVNADGTVGIGTITTYPPTGNYKLAVAGNIIAEKVRVKLQINGWPDYVFGEKYPLPTLKEIEKFIQQNKHLPGIPSAAEVEKDGLDLGDGQAMLLKKIEELTLHLIEMDKKLNQLSAENAAMKKKLDK